MTANGATLPADGRLLAISGNTALYSLLGARYGGDGVTTFGPP
jgi:microcystin-dependent protein